MILYEQWKRRDRIQKDFKHRESRATKRAKRRKTNIILNTLIAVVVILILLVGGKIFFGGDEVNDQATEEDVKEEQVDQSQPNDQDKDDGTRELAQNRPDDEEEESKSEDDEEEEEERERIEKETDEPNVEKVLIDPKWEPVGTEQVNGHQPSFTRGSIDWDEKHEAIAYAEQIPVDQMTTWWIEGGTDSKRQAIATVSAKNDQTTYRVYIEWVDGEGWKPTEVKKLIQNDKRR